MTGPSWEQVDATLRWIAERRAALDAEEAKWLREAETLQLWKQLGMVSMMDYMERVLGYAPHTAKERLRVAHALEGLPATAAAWSEGTLSFSAVRELTRVATDETEGEWVAAASEMNLRQIEQLVAEHEVGDRPSDPPKPEIRNRVVRFEVRPEVYAALRQARAVLADEQGHSLDDSELVAALVGAVLGGKRERAQHQMAVVVCPSCKQGWQDGAGARVPISAAAVARAECDAEHIGSLDALQPARARQDITPAVARFVFMRDEGRCRVPGCRSARCIDLHHLEARADGGSHDPENLICLCGSCHTAHHEGRLTIRGTASALEVIRSHVGPIDVQSHVGLKRLQTADAVAELGWTPKIALPAADIAIEELGDAPLDDLVDAALEQIERQLA